jgi:hypothetical protein
VWKKKHAGYDYYNSFNNNNNNNNNNNIKKTNANKQYNGKQIIIQ